MELQMAPQVAKSTRDTHTTPPHHHHHLGGGARPVPGYLRPSTSTASCHHVCKYGGTHEFEENNNDPKKKKKKQLHPKPRKPPPPQQPASSAESQSSRVMVKVRSVFRRRVGDSSTTTNKTSAAAGKEGGETVGVVEWKDIVVDDTTTTVPKPNTADVTKSITKPPKGKKKKMTKTNKPTSLLVEEMAAAMDQEALQHGYEVLSPSVMQGLEEEMAAVHGGAAAAIAEEEQAESAKPPPPPCSLNEEEYAAVAAAETKRPIVPAHRRAKSMSISSRSVRFPSNPIARQASKNSSVTFKLRSRSTKAPIAPPEGEEKPATMARMRSRRGGEDGSSGSIRGIQLRIRSLRRRGLGGGSGGVGAGGFVVPAVALRHQKTLEKKKSQRLYNNVIEETASKLVKTRKSRVKALVGAFESVISKIAK
ncbi:hypothetical protein HU200_057209 [Digitaria exilis]|uniref:Calmodulin-binding domain-containing protein n=1 Tax=Digitaria exilis TaxID=1010633 RepID=A0A835E4J3_9POAL|nr:hypothetical protein HU200_057209 [Digitaria exilis]CAB3465998.1 unnamed protein product [Digitaria exilis]